jgi:hypothetical protein
VDLARPAVTVSLATTSPSLFKLFVQNAGKVFTPTIQVLRAAGRTSHMEETHYLRGYQPKR